LSVHTVVTGSYPARTIVKVGKGEGVDLFLMGSVAQRVVHLFDNPVLIIPINKELADSNCICP